MRKTHVRKYLFLEAMIDTNKAKSLSSFINSKTGVAASKRRVSVRKTHRTNPKTKDHDPHRFDDFPYGRPRSIRMENARDVRSNSDSKRPEPDKAVNRRTGNAPVLTPFILRHNIGPTTKVRPSIDVKGVVDECVCCGFEAFCDADLWKNEHQHWSG